MLPARVDNRGMNTNTQTYLDGTPLPTGESDLVRLVLRGAAATGWTLWDTASNRQISDQHADAASLVRWVEAWIYDYPNARWVDTRAPRARWADAHPAGW